jgi:hypothetical protein
LGDFLFQEELAMAKIGTMQPSPTRGAYKPVPPGKMTTVFDSVPTPEGTVGSTDEVTLRGHMKRLLKGYDPHWGFEKCAEKWAEEVARVQALGAKAALTEFFNQNQGA